MPVIPIGPAGSTGIIKDKLPHELPLNAWTDGLNMRFSADGAEKVPGWQQVYDPPSIAPYHVRNVLNPNGNFWVYAGLNKIYATDGSSHANITRQSGGVDVNYAATADVNWTSSVLGGIAILNNGFDTPQMWLPGTLATRMSNLSNWPVNYLAQSVRAYKEFLVALDVYTGVERFPQMVMWSHPSDPGAVPISWDVTNPAVDAGLFELKETTDYCVDSASLRDIQVIYKQYSTHGMQFIGGDSIFRFFKIFDNIGLLTKRCAAEFFSGQQIVLTFDDLVTHDGQQTTSLLTERWRKALFNDMDSSKYLRNCLAVSWATDEVIVAYVPRGADFCTMALIWNFRKNELSQKELPTIADMSDGLVSLTTAASDAWDTDAATWDLDTTSWDDISVDPRTRRLLFAAPSSTKLYGYPVTTGANGATLTAFLERKGMGFPLQANSPPDYTTVKSVTRLWPHIEGEAGKTVDIYVGSQNTFQDTPVYKGPFSYVIGTTNPVDPLVTGRLHAIKFVANSNFDWRFTGYDVEVTVRGGKK